MAASGERIVATATARSKNATTGTTNSTSYITALPTAGTCGVAFVAPPSGAVTILFHTAGFNSAAVDNKTAVRVGTGASVGAGTQVYAPTDDDMILFTGSATYGKGSFADITGLTAGDTYNACLAHLSGAGNASFLRRTIKVIPDL